MDETKTAELLEAEWWQDWHARDFSWIGLKKHNLEGIGGLTGEKTLQEYWLNNRTDEEFEQDDELEKGPYNKLWHIVHLPKAWPDGKKTWKSNPNHEKWAKLEKIIAGRISVAQPTDCDFNFLNKPPSPDGRAQLQGTVLRYAAQHPRGTEFKTHLRADNSATTGQANYSSAKFGPGANFCRAAFFGITKFDHAIFEDGADFITATFFQSTSFKQAEFRGFADFNDAEFVALARFENTTFKKKANFQVTRFDEDADFNHAIFIRSAQFDQAVFSNVIFRDTEWQAGVSFKDAKVAGTPEFEGAMLHEDSTFDGADFTCLEIDINQAKESFRASIQLAFITGLTGWSTDGWLSMILLTLFLSATFVAIICFIFAGGELGDGKLERLTRAFRTLSRLCDNVRNRQDAAKFHQLELKAQRLRFGKSWHERLINKPIERAFSCTYEVVAGYGESIIRPFVFLLIVIVCFATLFWMWEGGGLVKPKSDFITKEGHSWVGGWDNADPNFIEALSFSQSRVFLLENWKDSDESCNFPNRLLIQGKDRNGASCRPAYLKNASPLEIERHRLLAKTLATLESIFGITIIFLFVLAIRRRFRIAT